MNEPTLGQAAAGAAEQVQRLIAVLTRHTGRRGKHAGGHEGQKARAKARRRGLHGKAVRRRRLAARREAVAARSAALSPVLRDEA